jgi:adenylate kinase
MKLVLLGPPGSGKGTVTEALLSQFPTLKHISAGVLLRAEIKNNTEIGKQVKQIVKTGDLVPAEVISKLILKEMNTSNDFILDGFPRSLDQIPFIQDIKIDLTIYLEVPQNIVIERLSARRMDPETKKIYNLKFKPAPIEIQDRLIQREDDTPTAISERFRVFLENTKPVIDNYNSQGILVTIDATKPIVEVQKEAVDIVKNHFNN